MATVLGIAAGFWGVLMALAPVLQIRRMIIRRSSADVSLGYFGVLLPGFALWVGYGLSRSDWPLVIPNAIALTVGAATIGAALVLRRRGVNLSPGPVAPAVTKRGDPPPGAAGPR